ncbi:MAG: glycosyltransferase family 2 protein [Pseudomonadota bacterium]
MTIPFVSVIIVNYNSGGYALDCIRSLQRQTAVQLEIIVVDNASQDSSVSILQSALSENIRLIKSQTNLGFGRANNLGALQARGEFLLLLNPDTVVNETQAIKHLVDALVDNPQIGLMAPLVNEPRKNKQVFARHTYPSQRYLKHTQKLNDLPGEIAWVLGACMLLNRDFFNQINGFDEDYFLYGEDIDICLRIRLAGYAIGFTHDVKIMHVSGTSEIGADSYEKWLRKRRGLYLFFVKHYHEKDRRRLAKILIRKANIYLAFHSVKGLFIDRNSLCFVDKEHRLKATITAASEMLANS